MSKKEKEEIEEYSEEVNGNRQKAEEIKNEPVSNETSELEKKEEEIQSLNDKYLRLYSEFENFRRRTQKERVELFKTAGADIFKSLLPVIDDFERAQLAMQDTKDVDGVKSGVELIYQKLITTLKQQGLEPMETSVGKAFDSEIHEAISQVPAPNKKMKDKIIDEVEKGYVLNDKVIRFAKVVVGK